MNLHHKQILMYVLVFIPTYHSLSKWAEETLHTLSLDEKIGQLFMAAVRISEQVDPLTKTSFIPAHMKIDYVEDTIKDYHIGGIIYLGKHTAMEQLPLTQQLQSQSAIPLLIGQDFEWGLGMRLTDCTAFPRARYLGIIDDADLTYQMAYAIGIQCRMLGIHINFAPVVDIDTNSENPIIGTRSFGNSPQAVIKHAQAFAHGLLHAGIIPCIKHFPGHGDTTIDSHFALPLIKHAKKRLNTIELAPFKVLIDNGIPAIMVAHLSVPALTTSGTPSSLSSAIVTDLLRNQYHFNGLVITDALDMGALSTYASPAEIALQAFKAGNDILLASTDIPKSHQLIKRSIDNNPDLLKELDTKVLRILKAKEWIFIGNNHKTVPETVSLGKLENKTIKILENRIQSLSSTAITA